MKIIKLRDSMTLFLSVAFVTIAGMMLWANLAVAGGSYFSGDYGPTSVDGYCMQYIYGYPVAGSNALNCTANDIKIARATEVSQDSCVEGSTFDLTATFEIEVTADERYRPGFFFRVDGGATALGPTLATPDDTGRCSLSRLGLVPPFPAESPAADLNGDNTGDLNSGLYEVTFTIPGILCQDNDGNGFLDLPNCTSWGNNKTEITDLYTESNFAPYNKSKCVCDDTFNVPVLVETASITVTKSGNPGVVPESGGAVFFNTILTNDATYVNVTIQDIFDYIIDNPTDANVLNTTDLTSLVACVDASGNATSTQTYCTPSAATTPCPDLDDTVLGPGLSASCQFSAWVEGDFDVGPIWDVVQYCGTDSSTNNNYVCDDDIEDTDIDDVFPVPTLAKTANPAGCILDVVYTVVVSNPSSSVDDLTLTALNDNKFGDLTTVHAANGYEAITATNCGDGSGPGALPIVLTPGNSYTCMFTGQITSSNCDINHVNTAEATTVDDDNKTWKPTGSATVTLGPPSP